MSGKRMIDLMIGGGIVNPARNLHLFGRTRPNTIPAREKELLRKFGNELEVEIRNLTKELANPRLHIIDYSNVFEDGINRDCKMQDWFEKWLKKETKESPLESGTSGEYGEWGVDYEHKQLHHPDPAKLEAFQKRQIKAIGEEVGPIRPPFNSVWMEAEIPEHLREKVSIQLNGHFADRIGFLMNSASGSKRDPMLHRPIMDTETQVVAGTYVKIKGKIFGPLCCVEWGMNNEGHLHSALRCAASDSYNWIPNYDKILETWTADILPTLFHALNFLNCKNVKEAKIQPSPKLSKRWQKKTGQPLSRYHVLTVGNTRNAKQERVETYAEGSEGHRRAQHITRGHFRTYTPDKPLFGHWHGTLWIDSHVRGSKEEGIVTKSYNLV